MRSIHANELMQTVPSFSMNLWDDSQDYTFEVPAAAKQLNAIRETSSTASSVSDALAPWEDHPTLMVVSWILAFHVCTVWNANSLTEPHLADRRWRWRWKWRWKWRWNSLTFGNSSCDCSGKYIHQTRIVYIYIYIYLQYMVGLYMHSLGICIA